MAWKYEDIVDLPRPASGNRVPMPPANRAAQFSPFAALTGFEAVIHESARQTERKAQLQEDAAAALNEALEELAQKIALRPEVRITFFEPDLWKAGGSYRSVLTRVLRIDPVPGTLMLEDGTAVRFDDISELTVQS